MSQTPKLEQELPEFISLSDAAKYLAVSERMVNRWVKGGILPAFRIKNTIRISRQEFTKFIESNTVNMEDDDGD